MPEGPEVKRNADLLDELVIGNTLERIELVSGKLLKKGIPGLDKFKPGVVTQVRAHGKLIKLTLDNGGELTSTLGMSGWWYPASDSIHVAHNNQKAYVGGALVPMRDIINSALKHARVQLRGDYGLHKDEVHAVYTDMRNFGNMEYWPDGMPEAELKRRIGFDLLNELPKLMTDMAVAKGTVVALKEGAPKRVQNMRMGDVALEQSFIAGLGNIYRAETFWLTGINPHVRLKDLPTEDWLKFCEVAMVVLQIAYMYSGSMRYRMDFIHEVTGIILPADHRGHLAYGRTHDICRRPIIRDDSFARPLWRLETA
jgi:formamidopyrimidine-DNA glycosylase